MKRTQYSPHFIPIEIEQALTFSVNSPLYTHSLHLPFHLPDKFLFLKYGAMSRHVCVSQLDLTCLSSLTWLFLLLHQKKEIFKSIKNKTNRELVVWAVCLFTVSCMGLLLREVKAKGIHTTLPRSVLCSWLPGTEMCTKYNKYLQVFHYMKGTTNWCQEARLLKHGFSLPTGHIEAHTTWKWTNYKWIIKAS